jgi:magnesium chelatase family protein
VLNCGLPQPVFPKKISGPLLDRIDIQIEVPAVLPEDLSRSDNGESSKAIRARVAQARTQMIARQGKENARLTTREIDAHCTPDEKGATLLKQAISRLGLSARGYHRILKIARTIADLAGMEKTSLAYVAEAIQYRRLDRAQYQNVKRNHPDPSSLKRGRRSRVCRSVRKILT